MGAVRDRTRARAPKALAWQRHIRGAEIGFPDGPGTDGVPWAEYDPERFTLARREEAKAAELTASASNLSRAPPCSVCA
uniref:hypothetical protein n=1 Tax=Streptomyces chartreusis TaxID=1969 RepID=UPI003F491C16